MEMNRLQIFPRNTFFYALTKKVMKIQIIEFKKKKKIRMNTFLKNLIALTSNRQIQYHKIAKIC